MWGFSGVNLHSHDFFFSVIYSVLHVFITNDSFIHYIFQVWFGLTFQKRYFSTDNHIDQIICMFFYDIYT